MHPVQSRPVHSEGAGDLYNSLAGIKSFDGLPPLMSGQLARLAEPHTVRLGPFAAFSGSGYDQFALELGKTPPSTVNINRP